MRIKKIDRDENICQVLLWEEDTTKNLAKHLLLEQEDVVVVPSETVYGLAGNALSEKAVHKIFKVKSRPIDNPLICHVSCEEQVFSLVKFEHPIQKELFILLQKTFWPGPLTMIFPKNPKVSNYAAQNFSTVALRMPNHPVFLNLLETVQVPLAAPSANISGRPSGTYVEDIVAELGDQVPLIIKDDNPPVWGIESTVLDLTVPEQLTVLRPGGISIECIREVLPPEISIEYGSHKNDENKSPGLKYAHYRPHFSVFLWDDIPQQMDFIYNRAFITYMPMFREHLSSMGMVWVYPEAKSLMQDLYHLLYTMEKQGIQELFIQAYPDKDGGYALMDRLRRIATNYYL